MFDTKLMLTLFAAIVKNIPYGARVLASGLQTPGELRLRPDDREHPQAAGEGTKPTDPLLQLITLFSRSAVMECRCVLYRRVGVCWPMLTPISCNFTANTFTCVLRV